MTCGLCSACTDANKIQDSIHESPPHATAPPHPSSDSTATLAQQIGTQNTPETTRFKRLLDDAIGQQQYWTPILEAERGLHGSMWALVASAPKDAPGPRLTLIKFEPSKPSGHLRLSQPPEHFMVMSQPVIDRVDAGRELANVLAAPKTRLRRLGSSDGLQGDVQLALKTLKANAKQVVNSAPGVDPHLRLQALANTVSASSRDVLTSPATLRLLFEALLDDAQPVIESLGTRRATVITQHATLTLLRRDIWSVGSVTPSKPRAKPPRPSHQP